MSKRAVFLDRDGVLNEAIIQDNKAYAPLTLAAFHLVPDAAKQVERLREAGLLCVVFTNQPEIARGRLRRETLEAMHRLLRTVVTLDDVLICTHDSTEGCGCHKPQPGMLRAAAIRWGIELKSSFVIGDRWRDVEAGRAAGCYTILIERSYSQCSTADICVAGLSQAVDVILRHIGGRA